MAKADTLTFSRRVKDLIWMEINFISQILGYSKYGLALFFVFFFLFRISMILLEDELLYAMTPVSHIKCKITEIFVCSVHHRTWYHCLFWQSAEGDGHSSWSYIAFFPPPKAVASLHRKDEKAGTEHVMPQVCSPAREFLWGAPQWWQCWHTRTPHCERNCPACYSLSVVKMAQKF